MIPRDLSEHTCKGKVFEVICGGCGAKLVFHKPHVSVDLLNDAREEIRILRATCDELAGDYEHVRAFLREKGLEGEYLGIP